jgi:diaminohydroxyphosphoribosylaminopyrimidine deaminase / 5-amino-6-(5-phosphoribosylamino)uracil reductase
LAELVKFQRRRSESGWKKTLGILPPKDRSLGVFILESSLANHAPWTLTDKNLMQRALTLASKARGRTSPNPLVGAVIAREGQIVGEGYHRKAGEAHAEVDALNHAGDAARTATLYVTLEPCCHWGRTPPCTEAVIRAGIEHVFVAQIDPNPKVAGNGVRQLENAGIRVDIGLCESDARRLNEIFIKYIQAKQPFVILKSAISLDGKIATATGKSQWITSEASRLKGHEIRDEVDAILVGIGTVFADNPSLTTRLPARAGKDPLRIVVDSRGRTPPTAQIFNPNSEAGVIVAVTEQAPAGNIANLEAVGAEVLMIEERQNRVCLSTLMKTLGAREITSVLIEGGGEINGSALAAGIVDKVMFFIAPKLIGGKTAPGPIGGVGIQSLSEAFKLRDLTVTPINGDLLIEGYLQHEIE